MTDKKIIEYKLNLKSPYTGMTEELFDRIGGIKVTDKVDMDLNRDGKVDSFDKTIAAKTLATGKKTKKVK